MFARNRNVRPESLIEAMEAAKPVVPGAVVGPDGIRRLPRTHTAGRDHRADSLEVQRDRRRAHLTVELDERFTLSAEVAAIFGDVAARLSAVPDPARWVGRLDRVLRADAVAQQQDWQAANTALKAIARIVHMPAPEVPTVGAEAIADGSWLAALVDACRPLDEPLSVHLVRETQYREQTRTARKIEPEPSPILDHLRTLDRAAKELDRELSRLSAPAAPAAVVDPMNVLRAKHSRELEELRERQAQEWEAASAALKATRLAAQAVG
ncbi:hypothetical protein [Nocardia wallacei]|uniref:hypothetical protein n=1 Tax=Nocardia wallacei TaxID=480035 RepID=UPI002453AA53|nr:hypothetical protein [Nocardia wallacei]